MKNYAKEREGEEAEKVQGTAKVVTSEGSLDLRLCHPDIHLQDSRQEAGESISYLGTP